ncbi:unnamed protein product [Phytophthora lilii]|uniref:Unnamed protein product n=1 Tax=Phytophthora lilii TaxID=2077276 RepID=A0A9W6X316_9STRA|nr:unnamed protein product [Phytophthora lilii]
MSDSNDDVASSGSNELFLLPVMDVFNKAPVWSSSAPRPQKCFHCAGAKLFAATAHAALKSTSLYVLTGLFLNKYASTGLDAGMLAQIYNLRRGKAARVVLDEHKSNRLMVWNAENGYGNRSSSIEKEVFRSVNKWIPTPATQAHDFALVRYHFR